MVTLDQVCRNQTRSQVYICANLLAPTEERLVPRKERVEGHRQCLGAGAISGCIPCEIKERKPCNVSCLPGSVQGDVEGIKARVVEERVPTPTCLGKRRLDTDEFCNDTFCGLRRCEIAAEEGTNEGVLRGGSDMLRK